MSGWKVYSETDCYFVTTTIVEWVPVFLDPDYFSIIINSLNYCSEEKGLAINGYVVMPNHLHLLVTAKSLSETMRDFKSFTSKEITRRLKERRNFPPLEVFKRAAKQHKKSEKYKVWQAGFHPKGIESESFYKQKLDYIHRNPVEKGYVTKPEHWFFSSARNYAGLSSYPLEVEML